MKTDNIVVDNLDHILFIDKSKETESMKSPGDVLKKAREDADLAQSELAKKLGYPNGQIVSNWERGLQGIPIKNAMAFCRHTGMKPEVMKKLLIDEATEKMRKKLSLKYKNTLALAK